MEWDIPQILAVLAVLFAVPVGVYKHRRHIGLYRRVLDSMDYRGLDISAYRPTFWTKNDASGAMIRIRRLTDDFNGRFTGRELAMLNESRRCYHQQVVILIFCVVIAAPLPYGWMGAR